MIKKVWLQKYSEKKYWKHNESLLNRRCIIFLLLFTRHAEV